jgi:antirestriction protein
MTLKLKNRKTGEEIVITDESAEISDQLSTMDEDVFEVVGSDNTNLDFEGATFDDVIEYFDFVDEHGSDRDFYAREAAIMDNLGSFATVGDYNQEMRDNYDEVYVIEASDEAELAEELIDQTGGLDQMDKETLARYFDFEAFGRDLVMGDGWEDRGGYFTQLQ